MKRDLLGQAAVWALFAGALALAIPATAQSAVKLKASGSLAFVPGATSSFTLTGEGSHLGRCAGRGEVTFAPGVEANSFIGTGVADLTAANGDHIVGVVTWTVPPDGPGRIQISWRDDVQFADGSTAQSTGRFATSRPPGIQTAVATSEPLRLLVVIAIIAILIG